MPKGPQGRHEENPDANDRNYVLRLELELAAKNRQIKRLQEALMAVTGASPDEVAEVTEPDPPGTPFRVIRGGLAALLGLLLLGPWLRKLMKHLARHPKLLAAGAACAGTAVVVAVAVMPGSGPAPTQGGHSHQHARGPASSLRRGRPRRREVKPVPVAAPLPTVPRTAHPVPSNTGSARPSPSPTSGPSPVPTTPEPSPTSVPPSPAPSSPLAVCVKILGVLVCLKTLCGAAVPGHSGVVEMAAPE